MVHEAPAEERRRIECDLQVLENGSTWRDALTAPQEAGISTA
jgi:hypothetical protein